MAIGFAYKFVIIIIVSSLPVNGFCTHFLHHIIICKKNDDKRFKKTVVGYNSEKRGVLYIIKVNVFFDKKQIKSNYKRNKTVKLYGVH